MGQKWDSIVSLWVRVVRYFVISTTIINETLRQRNIDHCKIWEDVVVRQYNRQTFP